MYISSWIDVKIINPGGYFLWQDKGNLLNVKPSADGKVNAAGFMSGVFSCIHLGVFLTKASDNNPVLHTRATFLCRHSIWLRCDFKIARQVTYSYLESSRRLFSFEVTENERMGLPRLFFSSVVIYFGCNSVYYCVVLIRCKIGEYVDLKWVQIEL